MKVIVDTNVPVVANKAAPQASETCITLCAHRLRDIQKEGTVVLDDGWHILREYQANLRSIGQPGVGDAFLKWVLINRSNPHRCEQVHITPMDIVLYPGSFVEFQVTPDLAGFDPSDCKFAAVAVAHHEHPPILNATDSDWWYHREALACHNIRVECICPDAPFM